MEVLPCSGVQYSGGSDCSQSSSGTMFVNQGESGGQAKLEDDRLNDSLQTEGPQIERQGQTQQNICEPLINIACQCGGASCCDCQVEGQKESISFRDVEDDGINEPCLAFENLVSIADTNESESPNGSREVELSFSEPTWLKGDEPVALWVKVCVCVQNLVIYYLLGAFSNSCLLFSLQLEY